MSDTRFTIQAQGDAAIKVNKYKGEDFLGSISIPNEKLREVGGCLIDMADAQGGIAKIPKTGWNIFEPAHLKEEPDGRDDS
jgi:hypothetical protein